MNNKKSMSKKELIQKYDISYETLTKWLILCFGKIRYENEIKPVRILTPKQIEEFTNHVE